jgi:hypothetical protein
MHAHEYKQHHAQHHPNGSIGAGGQFLGAPWILAAPTTIETSPSAQWGSPCGVLRFDVSRPYSITDRLRFVSWQSGDNAKSLNQRAGSTPSNSPVGGTLNVLRGLHLAIRLKVDTARSGTVFDASAEEESGSAVGTSSGGSDGSPSGFLRLHFLTNGNIACSIRPHMADTSTMNSQDYTADTALPANVWVTVTCMFDKGASGVNHMLLVGM